MDRHDFGAQQVRTHNWRLTGLLLYILALFGLVSLAQLWNLANGSSGTVLRTTLGFFGVAWVAGLAAFLVCSHRDAHSIRQMRRYCLELLKENESLAKALCSHSKKWALERRASEEARHDEARARRLLEASTESTRQSRRAALNVMRDIDAARQETETARLKAESIAATQLTINEELAREIARREEAQGMRDQLEIELRHAQKLEAIGQLAAGVAHELNTPIQFIGDNLYFFKEAFEALSLAHGSPDQDPSQEQLQFYREETPSALTEAIDGIRRVGEIVSAMKSLSHPGGEEMAATDINAALLNCTVVARNEFKYVAHLETDMQCKSSVICSRGDLSQVFLNLIVNAAHAMQEQAAVGSHGTLTVSTRDDAGQVIIEVRDTGSGIPDEIRDRVFDPFFTTKDVGKGTGQGLALAHAIVDRHHGKLEFESKCNEGTVFRIQLPLDCRHNKHPLESLIEVT